MAVLELKLDPTKRDLKMFGWMLLAFVVLLGGLVWWKFEAALAARWVWGVGGALWVVYTAAPGARKPIYLGWMYGAFPIGWVISHVILAVVFYLVITPIGLVMKLAGYDPMQRKFEPTAKTYWLPRKQVADVRQYFRQY